MWFHLEYSYFYGRSVKYFIQKILKMLCLWFYLFSQGVPNETKGMISLESNENIHKNEDRSYYVALANKASSVTL